MFDIEKIINLLKIKRPIFVSEADMQLELAWIIKEEYPAATIRLEYSPEFNFNMHIDILVIINGKWIPIELKYKTKKITKELNNEKFNLKTHGAKDINCYLYLKDIDRIEKIKENIDDFEKGYTIFITNDLSYIKAPIKQGSCYKDFSLDQGSIKKGVLDWHVKTGKGTKKNCEKPIVLKNIYKINWLDYSKVEDSKSGTFKILINEIK